MVYFSLQKKWGDLQQKLENCFSFVWFATGNRKGKRHFEDTRLQPLKSIWVLPQGTTSPHGPTNTPESLFSCFARAQCVFLPIWAPNLLDWCWNLLLCCPWLSGCLQTLLPSRRTWWSRGGSTKPPPVWGFVTSLISSVAVISLHIWVVASQDHHRRRIFGDAEK